MASDTKQDNLFYIDQRVAASASWMGTSHHRLVCHRDQRHSAQPKNGAPQKDPLDHAPESAF
ncbi:MAG: hypothetical protein WAK21_07955 [Candidatus Sulfotelmatobacter sp.]